MRNLTFAALLLTAAPVAALAAAPAQSASLHALTPAAFQAGTKVTDDPLEHRVIFSTRDVHREGWKLFRSYGHDNYLVASLDRKTGKAHFQVRQSLRYWGTKRDYHAAHYVGADGLRQVALSEARHGEDVCPTTENMMACPLSKFMAFDLGEDDVRAIAAQYQPGSDKSWAFKMKDRTGHDIVSGIAPAEAAGLLHAVDQYRASNNI